MHLHKDVIFLYGGTFDPPHYGHIQPLLNTADLLGITHIELLPAFIPALKEKVSASKHRLAMVRLLAQLDTRLSVNTLEIERNTKTYTIDTVKALKNNNPDKTIVFIAGADSLQSLHKWHNWQLLFDYCHLMIMQRPKDETRTDKTLALKLYKFQTEQCVLGDIVSSEMDAQSALYLSSKLAPVNLVKQCDNHTAFMDIIHKLTEGNLWLVNNQTIALSSTMLRKKLKANEDVSEFMPNTIIEYIKQHKLYQP